MYSFLLDVFCIKRCTKFSLFINSYSKTVEKLQTYKNFNVSRILFNNQPQKSDFPNHGGSNQTVLQSACLRSFLSNPKMTLLQTVSTEIWWIAKSETFNTVWSIGPFCVHLRFGNNHSLISWNFLIVPFSLQLSGPDLCSLKLFK